MPSQANVPQQPWAVPTEHTGAINAQLPPWGQTAAGVPGQELRIPVFHDQIAHPNLHHLQKLHVHPGMAIDRFASSIRDIVSAPGGLHVGPRR
jgi:hypothetical protein